MSDDSLFRDVDLDNPAYLIVAGPNSTPSVAPLATGSSVFVGSGSNCKIELADEQIKQIHCMLWMEANHTLKVQDWNTGTTYLNDAPVTDETNMKSGDVLTVGSHRLTAVLDREFHYGFAVELLNSNRFDSSQTQPQKDAETAQESRAVPQADAPEFSQAPTAPAEPVGFSAEMPAQDVDKTPATNGFNYDIDADLDDDIPGGEFNFNFSSVPSELAKASSTFNGDDDDISLMRMEVEQLRFELADRESKIQELQQRQSQPQDDCAIDESETLKLVTRLEDLLEELKSSDARINGLEELLRVSDHATQAEQEERRQLEQWVTEIEQRVGQREAEANAEISRLSKRLQDAKEESEHSASQLQSLATNGGDVSSDQQAAVTALAEQVELLRNKLREAREENQQLHQRPAASNEEFDAISKLRETEDELVRLKVEMSRERAEMARRHAELEGIRDELEDRLKNARVVHAGDTRIQTMRQHLREIHEREQAEKADKRTNGLGGRIANLLTRLR